MPVSAREISLIREKWDLIKRNHNLEELVKTLMERLRLLQKEKDILAEKIRCNNILRLEAKKHNTTQEELIKHIYKNL